MGLNEFAGYVAVAGGGAARPAGSRLARAASRTLLSGHRIRRRRSGLSAILFVRETSPHVALERHRGRVGVCTSPCRPGGVLANDADRSQPLDVSQAGLVNNLNDGMAWGLFPLVFAAANLSLRRIGVARGDLSRHVGHRAACDGGALAIGSAESG